MAKRKSGLAFFMLIFFLDPLAVGGVHDDLTTNFKTHGTMAILADVARSADQKYPTKLSLSANSLESLRKVARQLPRPESLFLEDSVLVSGKTGMQNNFPPFPEFSAPLLDARFSAGRLSAAQRQSAGSLLEPFSAGAKSLIEKIPPLPINLDETPSGINSGILHPSFSSLPTSTLPTSESSLIERREEILSSLGHRGEQVAVLKNYIKAADNAIEETREDLRKIVEQKQHASEEKIKVYEEKRGRLKKELEELEGQIKEDAHHVQILNAIFTQKQDALKLRRAQSELQIAAENEKQLRDRWEQSERAKTMLSDEVRALDKELLHVEKILTSKEK